MSGLKESETSGKVAQGSAEFVAMMLVYLAKAVIESVGEEKGSQIIRKGLREFGKERGRKIREKIDSLGLEATVATFTQYYDFPMFAAYKGTREFSGKRKNTRISFCPLAGYWAERGHEAIGLMYCDEVDDGIREGFDLNLVHSNPQNPLRGDTICEHVDEYPD
ncbi:MAG: L-2-amino-thiazoline-4-carboxylic acid hydrolase [Thermodesulfobacteriota bacterium]